MERLASLIRREFSSLKPMRHALPYCAGAALLGYVVNLVGVPVLGATELVFGSLFGVLMALAFGPYAGGTVAAIAGISTWINWGHPYGLIVFAMESWFIGWFTHRWRWTLLKAALVFWLLIGMPLTLGLVLFVLDPPFPSNWAIILKYPANAAMVVFFAQALAHWNRTWRWLRLPVPAQLADERVRDQLLRGVVMAGALPTVAFGIVAGGIVNRQQQSYLQRQLEGGVHAVAEHIVSYVGQHRRVIEAAAAGLQAAEPDVPRLALLLHELRQRNAGFITMLIAAPDGVPLATSPVLTHLDSVADRSYFQAPVVNGASYVSPVFRGRGFGNDLIVAISAAYTRQGARQVVEGSLDLKSLLSSIDRLPMVEGREVLVFDDQHTLVVHKRLASDESPSPAHHQVLQGRAGQLRVDNTPRDGRGRIHRHFGIWVVVPELGWKVYLREPAWNSFSTVARLYLLGAVTLVALLTIGLLVGRRFVRRLSAPFTQLVDYTAAVVAGQPPPELSEGDDSLPQEWRRLAQDLRQTALRLAETNYELKLALAERNLTAAELRELAGRLEERVAARTAELEAARRTAERASQSKTEFLSMISHELRTPLNVALGHLHLLLQPGRHPLPDVAIARVKKIKTSADHLLALINDLLDIAKLEAGKTELELHPVDVAQLCTECGEFFREEFQSRQLSFSLELNPPDAPFIADGRRLRQALINLLGNAAKFTPAGGSVLLSARIHPSRPALVFTVADTGIGIPPDQQQKLFQPFEQVDRSLSRKYGGTGLGLSIVRHLVALHGGTVEVVSAVGQGSRFILTLPLAPAKARAV